MSDTNNTNNNNVPTDINPGAWSRTQVMAVIAAVLTALLVALSQFLPVQPSEADGSGSGAPVVTLPTTPTVDAGPDSTDAGDTAEVGVDSGLGTESGASLPVPSEATGAVVTDILSDEPVTSGN